MDLYTIQIPLGAVLVYLVISMSISMLAGFIIGRKIKLLGDT